METEDTLFSLGSSLSERSGTLTEPSGASELEEVSEAARRAECEADIRTICCATMSAEVPAL